VPGLAEAPVYEDLTVLGLVGVVGPPSEEVAGAIRRCQDAGIRFIMMTGDQPLTALAIARHVGLVSDDAGDDEVVKGPELGDRAPPRSRSWPGSTGSTSAPGA